ncbi:HEPN domain-containing protein [Dyadobacter tibetensis]|uniref:HEPN domain-containing protein n=1 Tax=Dyadobacter tibetensis TaxID=1211851 RepID=UPI00047251FB|nr:HEPN domain-containing protein [Dyadobacter tibetensis]
MIKNSFIFEKLVNLLPKILPLIPPVCKAAYFPDQVREYPNLKYEKNGFPSISLHPSIIDVSQFFRPRYGKPPEIALKEYDDFNELFNYLLELPEIIKYYGNPLRENKISANEFLGFRCKDIIEGFIERYYYLHGVIFDTEKFENIYLPIENYIFSKEIHFDISIPILFIHFETEYFEITPTIILRKITDESHRARHKIVGYSPAIVDSVFMSATHELVLKDYSYKKPENWLNSPFSKPKIYPHELIERFFSIFKIATNHTSGYAQMIIHPNNWADTYQSDLLPLDGASVRNYPAYFDDFFWNNKEYPEISLSQIAIVKQLFLSAQQSTENKLAFALKRFYKSTTRQEEEDIIIDLIIALEILLGDSEKSEITHKLALRVSALICFYNKENYDPLEVFANIKKIYAYRSSIVHGSHKVSNKREIKLKDDNTVPIVRLANEYLNEILKIVLMEPKHLNSIENDKLLLQNN